MEENVAFIFFNKQYFIPKLDCGEDEKMAVIFTYHLIANNPPPPQKKKMLEKPKIDVRFPVDLGITSNIKIRGSRI